MSAKIKYTREERERIVDALKALCVAKAEFWDALRAVEVRLENCEVETGPELEGTLAADYNTPPSPSDVADRHVWRAFLSNAQVRRFA